MFHVRVFLNAVVHSTNPLFKHSDADAIFGYGGITVKRLVPGFSREGLQWV